MPLAQLSRCTAFLATTTYWATAACAGGFLLVLIAGMTSRLMNHPLRFAEELGSLLFVWSCFGGAALAYRRGSHIRLQFLQERLPLRYRRALEQGCRLAAIFFLALVVAQSLPLMSQLSAAQMPITGLPQWLAYLPVPIFCGVMLAFALESFLASEPDPKPPADIA